MDELNCFKYGYCSWKNPRNWFHNIKNFFVTLKYARQRAVKGYCDYDLWDLDIFYRNLLIESLKDFKKRQCGYPSNMKSEEEWSDYLNKMIEHFEKSKTWWERDDQIDEEMDNANAMIEYLTHERELEEETKEHLKQGFEMLSKHFNSLWI